MSRIVDINKTIIKQDNYLDIFLKVSFIRSKIVNNLKTDKNIFERFPTGRLF